MKSCIALLFLLFPVLVFGQTAEEKKILKDADQAFSELLQMTTIVLPHTGDTVDNFRRVDLFVQESIAPNGRYLIALFPEAFSSDMIREDEDVVTSMRIRLYILRANGEKEYITDVFMLELVPKEAEKPATPYIKKVRNQIRNIPDFKVLVI
jgi:hypothetical protein